jgi:secreted PhoX family phosphatase
LFPNPDDYVGYNADYTGFVPISDHDKDDEHGDEQGYLWVNHEYMSYPASTLAPAIPGRLQNSPTTDYLVLGFSFPKGSTPTATTLALRLAGLSAEERRQLYGEFYYNLGGSVLVISRHNHREQWEVSPWHPKNCRLHGLSGLAINATHTDGYATVTSWEPARAPYAQPRHRTARP